MEVKNPQLRFWWPLALVVLVASLVTTASVQALDEAFMTGGGSVTIGKGKDAQRYTHGFNIQWDGSKGNFEYNDHSQKGKFHLESITSVRCTDDSTIDPDPPSANFDTLEMTGTGRWNKIGATIEVTLSDAGQPGRDDTIDLTIKVGGNVVSSVSGNLTGGNHQAHGQVTKANPSLGTTPTPTSGTIGVTLQDSATLTGAFNPTGKIDFKLFDPTDPDCTTQVHSESVDLIGNSASTATGFAAKTAGPWNWTADYAGDANNNSASSACGQETVAIAKNRPSLGTTPTPTSGSIGVTLQDSATLTGAFNPTGKIDFKLFDPTDPDCTTPVHS